MPCSHSKSCELFAQFALNPALKVWQVHYCEANYKGCARYELATRGHPVPLNLLPNGQTVQAPRSSSAYGATALFNAILKQRNHMVASLLRTGVDPNLRNSDGMTPLMAAVNIGNAEIVKLLLTKGADARALNHQGETAYGMAQRLGHTRIVEFLAAYAPSQHQTQSRTTPARRARTAPRPAVSSTKSGLGFSLKGLFQPSK